MSSGLAILSAVLLASLCVGGCGGSGGATATEMATSKEAAERERAGAAAPFLEPHGDNSIPTFGREAPRAERGEAEAALGSYLGDRAIGAWAKACAGLAAKLARQLERLGSGRTCPATYRALSKTQPRSARANPLRGTLLSLRLKGDDGFALFYGSGKQKYVVPMIRENGSWKVARLDPYPYPLGLKSGSP